MVKKVIPTPHAFGHHNTCSRCLDQFDGFSRLIVACSCEDNPSFHESCLEKEINFVKERNPSVITRSEFEGF